MKEPKLVIIEDEEAHFDLMKRVIAKQLPSASLYHFKDAQTCFQQLDAIQPDIVIVDYLLPGMSGLEFLEALNREGRDVPVVMITGQGSEHVAVQAMKMGAWDYLVKSVDFFHLLPATIQKVIRERKLRESLHKSARLNELLLDSLPHPAMLIRRDRTILAANRVAREFGARLGGYCWLDFAHEEHIPEADRYGLEGQPGEVSPGGLKCRFCRADEALAEGRSVSVPEVEAFGRFWETWWIPIDHEIFFHYTLDITERKQAEEAIRASEARYRGIVEDQTEMICRFLPDYTLTFVNTAYCRSFKRDRKELVGKTFLELIPPEDRSAVREFLDSLQLLTPDNPVAPLHEHRVLAPEGGIRWQQWTNRAIFDESGKLVRFQAVGRDITEKRRMEGELRASEERFRMLFECAPDGLFLVDFKGTILDANRVGEELCGYRRQELVGENLFEMNLMPRGPARRAAELLADRALHSPVGPYEFIFTRKDGQKVPVEVRSFSARINEQTLVLGIARDITERKRAEEALQASKRFLEIANRHTETLPLLRDFVAEVRHLVRCSAVGVRLLDEHGRLPYVVQKGFNKTFHEFESDDSLSAHSGECPCVRVMKGPHEPEACFTAGGSFVRNSGAQLPETDSIAKAEAARCMCWQLDYGTVGLFPIRFGEQVGGLIQVADRQEQMLSPDRVELLERAANELGAAIHRLQMEDALRDSERQLRLLSARLLSAQEAERQRIARDLHDSIGQILASLKMGIGNGLRKVHNKSSSEVYELLEGLIPTIHQAIQETRSICSGLRPSILDNLGILAAIRWFCEELQAAHPDYPIQVETQVEERDIPEDLKITIFRVLQEALNNVVKYSCAKRVWVSLIKQGDSIELSVEDSGVGFDMEASVDGGNTGKGLGLMSMRERTELSGGTFWIESVVGEGTTVWASWPGRA